MKMVIPLVVLILIFHSHNTDPAISKHILPVYGNASLGYYYINVYVGTPPQEQSVIIDTGSGQFALPCSQCKSCGQHHIHPPFDIKKSATNKILTCASQQKLCKQSCSSASANPCKFSISYAQGSSLSGIVLQDKVQFQQGSLGENIQTTFGCTTRQTNLFFTQAANGIFGLSPHRNSRVLDLLYQSHSKSSGEDLVFSMCLAQNGGQMAIGGINGDLNIKEEFVKTTFDDSKNVYTLNFIGDVRINKTVIRSTQDLGYFGMFIDSGSTFTYFKYDKFQKLQVQLQNICARHSSQCLVAKNSVEKNCFKITPNAGVTIKKTLNEIFSPIEIDINGKTIQWTSDKYFVLRSLKNREVCLSVYGLDRFLLGANWMTDMNIAFNLREKTVSIYPYAECKKKNVIRQAAEHQQLSLYNGEEEKSPMQYFQASIREDDFFVTKIIILILVILLIFAGLIIMATKVQPKVEQKKKPVTMPTKHAQDESTIIKQAQSQDPVTSQRNLSNQQNDQESGLTAQKQKQPQKKEYQLIEQGQQHKKSLNSYEKK